MSLRSRHIRLHGTRCSRILTLCLLIAISASGSAQNSRKEVIGYYPSWKWRSRDNLVTPARLPYDKLTIINYAFFVPLPDGRISGKDTVGDRLYLNPGTGQTLVDYAHNRGVKVLLSLGGWTDSDNFPSIAANPGLRAVLARSCNAAIVQYGFDGIDIDWEYPGYSDHKGTAADKENFTLLLLSLRDSLDALGRSRGENFLLTAALPAGGEHARNIDVEKISQILDQLNLMTYDYYGPWDSLANHNCPLYPSEGADTTRSVDASYRLYHDTFGVPASRINLGLPFYGKAYAKCVALNSPHAGADTAHFPASGPFYYDIVSVPKSFTRYWDDRAKAPYLVSAAWQLLVSYDDEESIRAKAQYVAQNDVHGVIIWEITGDYLPDGKTPLLDALTQALAAAQRTTR